MGYLRHREERKVSMVSQKIRDLNLRRGTLEWKPPSYGCMSEDPLLQEAGPRGLQVGLQTCELVFGGQLKGVMVL